ncbi:T-complex protein [Salix suchowensis]|nr:T-complex protein [Salix suchowensis]
MLKSLLHFLLDAPTAISYVDNKRKEDIRHANIKSACAVADAVRTSLGPKGMDKMISTANGEVIITNDGATILNKMEVLQPAAKMLVELSKSQDAAAGDGTTTVVVIAGSLLKQCLTLLSSGIHPTVISDSLHKASIKAVDVLTAMAVPWPRDIPTNKPFSLALLLCHSKVLYHLTQNSKLLSISVISL